jgi:hypothetical protein
MGLHLLGEKLGLGTRSNSDNDDDDEDPTEDAKTSAAVSILKRLVIADEEPDFWLPESRRDGADESHPTWKMIVEYLATAIDGSSVGDEDDNGSLHSDADILSRHPSSSLRAWAFDARPVLEHAIVYACCKSGDVESLCLARSICGQGVTLRPSSPEEWWRYSIVLGLLGDDVASEEALVTSVRVGAGQGARKV